MGKSVRVAALSAMALTVTALLAVPAAASATTVDHGGAVFVETDGLTGNQVVVYTRESDGSLQPRGTYSTLGKGGMLDESVVDHTASQGAVAYDPTHRLLYAVNAGSNTVTVFSVRADGTLTRLDVVGSGGEFPVSVAVHGSSVYVLNARGGGSVQGFLSVGGLLVRVPTWNRPLGLDATAVPEFTHTPGQVAVSPDGRQLLVTTKGNTNAIDVFGRGLLGEPSRTPVITTIPGAVPFAMTFDQAGHVVVAEAGPSDVATFSLTGNATLVPVRSVATGQAATCWVARAGNFVYTGNAGSSTVSGYELSHDGTFTALGNTAAGNGTVDVAASPDGTDLYARSGGDGTIHAFQVNANGSLTALGSVTVPNGVGGEGIAVS
jgi:6-phosphogluconolactonase (cycloisomerase 2 family)